MKIFSTAITLALLSTPVMSQEKSTYFYEEAIPSSGVGDFGKLGEHRYGDHKFGYFHLHQSLDGKKWTMIEFSDGSRNDNQFYASLICKDYSGNVIDVLSFNRKLGASIKTMEHKYSFRVTCPGPWTVGWGAVKTNVNYTGMAEALAKVALSTWVGS